jgi:nucleoside diphosphate kinase
MDSNNQYTERHKELSLMFLKMGRALVDEGLKNKDYITASVGNNMIFMSSIVFDKSETRLFGELCSMMTSKRVIKKITNGTLDITKLENMKRGGTDDPYEQILRRIKKDFGEDGNDDKSDE